MPPHKNYHLVTQWKTGKEKTTCEKLEVDRRIILSEF